jgi:hypothetical protein
MGYDDKTLKELDEELALQPQNAIATQIAKELSRRLRFHGHTGRFITAEATETVGSEDKG